MLQLGNGDQLGGEASVHTEDLVVDKSGDWHAVEDILEFFPQTNRKPILALVIEAVNSIDLATLVIASQQEEVLLELDLVCKQQYDGLDRLLASIHVIAEEKVVSLRGEASIFK